MCFYLEINVAHGSQFVVNCHFIKYVVQLGNVIYFDL